MKVNQTELAEILGLTSRQIRNYCDPDQYNPPMPYIKTGSRAATYESEVAIQWYVDLKIKEFERKNTITADDEKAAKAREAVAKADLREIQRDEKRGQLLRKEDVRLAWVKMLVNCKKTLLGMSNKVALSLEDGLTYDEKKSRINKIVREALDHLAEEELETAGSEDVDIDLEDDVL